MGFDVDHSLGTNDQLYDNLEEFCYRLDRKSTARLIIRSFEGSEEVFLRVLVRKEYSDVVQALEHLSLVLNELAAVKRYLFRLMLCKSVLTSRERLRSAILPDHL